MKKIILAISLFVLSPTIFAQSFICPKTLTCNYDTGICDMPSGWILPAGGGAASEPFSGPKSMNISVITAFKIRDFYQFTCRYDYGQHSSFMLVTNDVKKLTGNWTYSGFGKASAVCATPSDPNSCVGE